MRAFRFVVAVVVVATLTVTCGDDSRPPTGPTPPPTPGPGPTQTPTLTRIVISGPNTIAPGETTQLTLTAEYNDGSTQDQTAAARWSTANGTVLKSGAPGQYTGAANGELFISVQFGGRFASREIVVVPTGTFRVTGTVVEASNSSVGIGSAHVKVRDRFSTGPSTNTDFNGSFKLYGVKPDSEFLVSRPGYIDVFKGVTIDRHSSVIIDMALAGPRLQVAGTYTATFEWSSCTGATRDELRQRTFTAVLTQSGARVDAKFTEPSFLVNSLGRGNVMEGKVDPSGLFLTAQEGFYSYYYGPSYAPMLIEVLPDNTKLVISGTASLTQTGQGFSGSLQGGRATHWGTRYPVDTVLGSCTGGSLRLDRR